jgi:hypothetical protein
MLAQLPRFFFSSSSSVVVAPCVAEVPLEYLGEPRSTMHKTLRLVFMGPFVPEEYINLTTYRLNMSLGFRMTDPLDPTASVVDLVRLSSTLSANYFIIYFCIYLFFFCRGVRRVL